MTPLHTPRLHLRNFQADDWEPLWRMVRQYQASPYAVYDHPWPTDPAGIQGAVRWFATGDSYLAVCLQDSGRWIGFVSLTLDESAAERAFDLGYGFDFDHHGHGYATEACQVVLREAFTTRAAARVVSGTAAVNAPSRALLARLGLVWTGSGTACFQQAADGSPLEFVGCCYAITREEWALPDGPPPGPATNPPARRGLLER